MKIAPILPHDNFLAQLIRRTTAVDADVSPRLPSLFEPAATGAHIDNLASDENGVAEEKNARTLPLLRTQQRNAITSTASGDFQEDAESNVSTAMAQPFDRSNVQRVSQIKNEGSVQANVAPRVQANAFVMPDAQREPFFPESKTLALSPRERSGDGSAAMRPQELSSAISIPPQSLPESSTSSVSADDNHPIEMPPLRGFNEQLIPPMSTLPPLPRDALETTSEPAATINVTIGRLEIRATQASTPTRTKMENTGVRPLSLEEYLKQRGREK